MGRRSRRHRPGPPSSLEHLAYGGARKVTRQGREWLVRDIPGHRAEKVYRCPACERDIEVGQAHVVAWSAEHLFGDDAAIADRRHWHLHCWRIA